MFNNNKKKTLLKSYIKFNIICIDYIVFLYVLYYYSCDVKSEFSFIIIICC